MFTEAERKFWDRVDLIVGWAAILTTTGLMVTVFLAIQ